MTDTRTGGTSELGYVGLDKWGLPTVAEQNDDTRPYRCGVCGREWQNWGFGIRTHVCFGTRAYGRSG